MSAKRSDSIDSKSYFQEVFRLNVQIVMSAFDPVLLWLRDLQQNSVHRNDHFLHKNTNMPLRTSLYLIGISIFMQFIIVSYIVWFIFAFVFIVNLWTLSNFQWFRYQFPAWVHHLLSSPPVWLRQLSHCRVRNIHYIDLSRERQTELRKLVECN